MKRLINLHPMAKVMDEVYQAVQQEMDSSFQASKASLGKAAAYGRNTSLKLKKLRSKHAALVLKKPESLLPPQREGRGSIAKDFNGFKS